MLPNYVALSSFFGLYARRVKGDVRRQLKGEFYMQLKHINILFFVILLTGCATGLNINYPLDDIPKPQGSNFLNSTLLVSNFENLREVPQNIRVQYKNPGIVKRNDANWYFNSDECYKEKSVSPLVTQMVAKHIEASNIFQSIAVAPSAEKCNYTLKGKIKKFRIHSQGE